MPPFLFILFSEWGEIIVSNRKTEVTFISHSFLGEKQLRSKYGSVAVQTVLGNLINCADSNRKRMLLKVFAVQLSSSDETKTPLYKATQFIYLFHIFIKLFCSLVNYSYSLAKRTYILE